MVSEKKNHVGFSTRIGFVLAAAGSAVGLGIYGDFHTLPLNTEAVFFCWFILFWQ